MPNLGGLPAGLSYPRRAGKNKDLGIAPVLDLPGFFLFKQRSAGVILASKWILIFVKYNARHHM